jgi:hypothetical protein
MVETGIRPDVELDICDLPGIPTVETNDPTFEIRVFGRGIGAGGTRARSWAGCAGHAGFAIGTALPLLGLGLLSREALLRWRGRMLAAGTNGKRALGLVLLATGVFILTGLDKPLEAALLQATPAWITEVGTRF